MSRRPPHRPPRQWPLTAALLLAVCVAVAAPGDRPGVFLEGATVARAKALALDAALLKGWRLTESGRAHSIFETTLEEPASLGPPDAVAPDKTLLRIRADYVATPAGVNTYLYAEEIWWAGTEGQWIADVTKLYYPNLSNALASLQRQWGEYRRRHPGRVATTPARPVPAERPRVRVQPAPPPASGAAAHPPAAFAAPSRSGGGATPPSAPFATPPPAGRSAPVPVPAPAPAQAQVPPPPPPPPTPEPVPVGTWAYYAEQYATSRGCVLGELGAELVSSDGASELHRVHCADGASLLVRCEREGCGAGN